MKTIRWLPGLWYLPFLNWFFSNLIFKMSINCPLCNFTDPQYEVLEVWIRHFQKKIVTDKKKAYQLYISSEKWNWISGPFLGRSSGRFPSLEMHRVQRAQTHQTTARQSHSVCSQEHHCGGSLCLSFIYHLGDIY